MPRALCWVGALVLSSGNLFGASSVWEVKSGENRVRIAALIDFVNEQDLPLPPEFERAYAEAEQVVFEADALEFSRPQIQARLMRRMMLAEKPLPDRVEQETYLLMAAACRSFGISEDMFDNMHPAMAMENLGVIQRSRLGYSSDFSLSSYFDDRARVEKKTIGSLDPVEVHFRYLASLGEGIEDEFMLQKLSWMQGLEKKVPKIREAWKNGDADLLTAFYLHEMLDDYPDVYDALVKNRNEIWVPVLARLLRTKQTELVLVPVENLLGPNGLLTLLERDYTLTYYQLPDED